LTFRFCFGVQYRENNTQSYHCCLPAPEKYHPRRDSLDSHLLVPYTSLHHESYPPIALWESVPASRAPRIYEIGRSNQGGSCGRRAGGILSCPPGRIRAALSNPTTCRHSGVLATDRTSRGNAVTPRGPMPLPT